jgi:hypothetical protein
MRSAEPAVMKSRLSMLRSVTVIVCSHSGCSRAASVSSCRRKPVRPWRQRTPSKTPRLVAFQ